jgi:hypothetical protein
MFREPRPEERTIYTTIAPVAVFTVRTPLTKRRSRGRISAQIRPLRTANSQLTAVQPRKPRLGDKSQAVQQPAQRVRAWVRRGERSARLLRARLRAWASGAAVWCRTGTPRAGLRALGGPARAVSAE